MSKKEIRTADCCEMCVRWTDKDRYMGFCGHWKTDTALTEVCDQWRKVLEVEEEEKEEG